MEVKRLDDMAFEEAMAELEALVRKLEDGRFPLEEAVKAYERGTALRQHCEKKLQTAKMKVEQILANPDGTMKKEPMDQE